MNGVCLAYHNLSPLPGSTMPSRSDLKPRIYQICGVRGQDAPSTSSGQALATAGGTLRLPSGQAADATVVFPQPAKMRGRSYIRGSGRGRGKILAPWAELLLVGIGGGAGRLAVGVMSLHLLAVALHFVPLLLLVRVKQSTDLVARGLVDIHHLGVPVLLGQG